MSKWKSYTPEGVQDQLFESCLMKRNLESTLRDFFRECEYREIETPVLEFYDTYASDKGIIDQESMFKLVDQRGRLLVLRPDMTVPVARAIATKMKNYELPIKCFYIGDCFSFNESGGGRLREYTQAGIEFVGAQGAKADAECIVMAIVALQNSGIKEFQIDLGQVEFFKGLMDEAGLETDEMEEVRKLIDSKDLIGLERVLDGRKMRGDVKELILNLPAQFGSFEIIEKLLKMGLNERCKNALMNLWEINSIVEKAGYGQFVSIDLGFVQSLDYYSGLIFKGFTYDVGFPILTGGRYDDLVGEFGYHVPATGFSLGINMLMMAKMSQEVSK
ncbi:MAG: ATP phosphoribosyltransferase regulatory subunit [Bacillota bacterium]